VNFKICLIIALLPSFLYSAPSQEIPHGIKVEKLFSILKENQVHSVKEAIQLFSEDFFEKENYALVFNSLSPQTSSADAPRILLFGKDRKIRMGFNHHKKTGQDLEVIQWRDSTQTWEFREIKFSKNGPTISSPNPNLCMQCHDNYKPKFEDHFLQSMRKSAKARTNTDAFYKKVAKDPIYRKFKSLPLRAPITERKRK